MKKEKVDIVIRYEHKVRELESIMLIKIEMERRGYSVAFVANYDYKNKKRYDPRLVLSPAIYNDGQIMTDITRYGLKKKIANLLWEQLFGISEEESLEAPHNIFGIGQRIIAFCWGNKTKLRLTSAGMPEDKTKVVGQINTDLLRGSFKKLLTTKEQLSAKFGIPSMARWNLFISSFAYCELDEIQKSVITKECGSKYLEEFTNISNESRDELFKWFEEAVRKYPDDVFIYRPHPDEMAKSFVLKKLSLKYRNFYVIADLSLKHWCNASDKIYNWYSTGMIDALFLNKPCRILRPCYIAREYDYRLFYNTNQIKSLQEFLDDYEVLDTANGLDPQMLNDYYYLPKQFVYKEICNILEEMLNTDKYDIRYTQEEKNRFMKAYLKAEISRSMGFCKPILRKLGLFKNTFAKSDVTHKALDEGFEKNVATEDEIRLLYSQLKPIVYGQEV